MKYRKYKETVDYKRFDSYQKEITKCKCGHSVFLPIYEPVKICSFCGKIVYKNDKVKFKYYFGKKKALKLG